MAASGFNVVDLVAKLNAVVANTNVAVDRGLQNWGEYVLQQAQTVVPIETGLLSSSGRVVSGDKEVAIGFGSGAASAYALRQHEDMTYKHDSGRSAKYLEKPAIDAADQVEPLVGMAIKQVLGG